MARTDAAAAFLMGVLIDQGVMTLNQMDHRLDEAIIEIKKANNGEVIASVFSSMKALLAQHVPKLKFH